MCCDLSREKNRSERASNIWLQLSFSIERNQLVSTEEMAWLVVGAVDGREKPSLMFSETQISAVNTI